MQSTLESLFKDMDIGKIQKDEYCTVFIRGIPLTIETYEIVEAFAKILHSPFKIAELGQKVNFDVFILQNKRGYTFNHGFLHLPSADLVYYVTRQNVTVGGYTLALSSSHKATDPSILLKLRGTAWTDPAIQRDLFQQSQVLKETKIQSLVLYFGKQCWDGVFSCESTHSGITLGFDLLENKVLLRHSCGNYYVFTPNFLKFVRDEVRIYIELEYPGIFRDSYEKNTDIKYHRLKALVKEDQEISPFCSGQMVLVFPNLGDVNRFFESLKKMTSVRAKWDVIILEKRGLYAEKHKVVAQDWFTKIPFVVAFQLEALICNRVLDYVELLSIKRELDKLNANLEASVFEQVLVIFSAKLQSGETFSDSDDAKQELLACLQSAYKENQFMSRKYQRFEDDHIFCRTVGVTPTMQLNYDGPYLDQSNRVLREYEDYQENFLSISFTDEAGLRISLQQNMHIMVFLQSVYGEILKNGIVIAGRQFEFLAYSNSALRSHSVYFVTPFVKNRVTVNAETIRRSMGDFSKETYFPARYGARVAQAFTSTYKSVEIESHQLKEIPDIVASNGQMFTDGVGKISHGIAKAVVKLLNVPIRNQINTSSFQIRLGGLKGMLVVDSTLEGDVLHWRESMNKFSAPNHQTLEIAKAFTGPMDCYLNRPLIKILEDLGIPNSVFLKLQKRCVEETLESTQNLYLAGVQLEKYGMGSSFAFTSFLRNLASFGIELHELEGKEKYKVLNDSIKYGAYDILRDLKHRGRIHVPGSYVLVGVADEWSYLKEGEIYACITDKITGEAKWLKGPICISRSPSLHPGDVQMVTAVGKVAVKGLCDVKNAVVFSTKNTGSELPLPSQLSGGDLDGDIFVLLTDPELHPASTVKAYSYPSATKYKLDRPCTIDDIADFVLKYISSDILGIISTRHLVLADLQENGTRDPDCIKLAEYASLAVDFPKSGTPVTLAQIPFARNKLRPDFLSGEIPSQYFDTYPSQKVLGELYRSIELKKPTINNSQESRRTIKKETLMQRGVRNMKRYDSKLASDPVTDLLLRTFPFLDSIIDDDDELLNETVARVVSEFTYEIQSISSRLGFHFLGRKLQEAECLLGVIINDSKQHRVRREIGEKLRTQTTQLYKRTFHVLLGEFNSDEKIAACFKVWKLYQEGKILEFGKSILAYCALQKLMELLNSMEE